VKGGSFCLRNFHHEAHEVVSAAANFEFEAQQSLKNPPESFDRLLCGCQVSRHTSAHCCFLM